MTYEEIKSASAALTSMNIKGKDYIPVNERIKAFRQLMPGGSISTEILSLEDGVVTIKATVRDAGGRILATGHGQEKETSSYINKTSFVENCETSAVGRALGFIGIGVDTSIATYEEVANAQLNQTKAEVRKAKANADAYVAASDTKKINAAALAHLEKVIEENGILVEYVCTNFGVESLADLSEKDYQMIVKHTDNCRAASDKWAAKQ